LIDGDRGTNYPKQGDFSPEGFCLFLSAKNVSKNGFIFNEVSFISQEKDRVLRKGRLERGDIILTSRGTVGNVAYYDEKIPFDHVRINSGMLIVRHVAHFDPVFLYRYFSGPQMEAKYSSMGSGSAQPQLPVGSLEQIEIPLMPISEQKEIASIISAVNEKITVNKKLKEKLTILKKGLMNDLLSGRVRVL
jgi:type I restriction enzyme S subunit